MLDLPGLLEKNTGFMGCAANYAQAGLVLVGAPLDLSVSFRPGTRFGPQQIRQVSPGLEEYSVYLDKDLGDYIYYDAGDIALPPGNLPDSLRRIRQVSARLLADGKFPLVLGGEHLISLAVLQAVAQIHPGVAVVVFDAHADLRDQYLGETYSHATVMRRIAEVVGGGSLYQFGVRSGTKEELAFARENTRLYLHGVTAPLREVLPQLRDRPVYVSLDIDVVDPAYAPGTGAPEPGGCAAAEITQAIHLLDGLHVVGFDLVEVSPPYDPAGQTALLAAKLVREAILTFAAPPNL